DQAIVGRWRPMAERHGASLRVDRCPRRKLNDRLVGGEFVVTELLRPEVAKAGDDAVAEWTGNERWVRLDQRHGDARIDPFDETSAARSAEAAAHDDHAPAGALGDGGKRQEGCARGRGLGGLSPAPAPFTHDRAPPTLCPPYHAAM